jgi:hypothetical protein
MDSQTEGQGMNWTDTESLSAGAVFVNKLLWILVQFSNIYETAQCTTFEYVVLQC